MERLPDHEALVDELRTREFLVSDALEAAVADTPREPFLHEAAAPLAGVDVPAPIVDATRQAAPCASPRLTVTLLEAASIEPGHTVLVRGRGVAWLAALADRLTGEGTVLLVEDDERLVEPAREALADRAEDVRVLESFEALDEQPDRIVVPEPGLDRDPLADALAQEGLLVSPVADEEGVDLVRAYKDGDQAVEVRLGGTHIASQAAGLEGKAPERLHVSQLLGTEALLRDAWTRDSAGATAGEVREAVEETIGRALAERGLRAEDPVRARTAQGAFHVAYVHQMTGEFEIAMAAYTASAAIVETAEAYTFRGWTRSFLGDLEGAIDDCKTAIEVDPAFGNAYNDIGAYRLEQDRPEDAVDWLEDAVEAERYSSRHFPYLNLGRAHLQLGNRDEAREALQRALDLDPGNEAAKRLLSRLGDV